MAYVALLAALIRAPLGIAVTILIVGSTLTLPMLPVYLMLVARLPADWPVRKRRLAAVAVSPLLLALFAAVLGAWIAPTGVFLFLVALPAAAAYGLVIRLPATPARPPS